LSLELALRDLTWAVYLAIFLLVLRRALRTPTPGHRDIAVFFAASAVLIALVSLSNLLPGGTPSWVGVATAVVALALPYLLLRVVAGFAPTPPWVLRGCEVGLVLIAFMAALTSQPAPAFVALVFVLYFVVVTGYDTVMLARSAAGTRGVTRRRMQAAALGSAALALAVVLSALATIDAAHAEPWTILGRLMALTSACAYYVGFAPPAWLRHAWQAPALQAFLDEVTRLPYLANLTDLLTELEAHASAIVGAPSAAIGLWQQEAGVLRFWRGLGARPRAAPYPADVSSRGFSPHDEVIDVAPERLLSGRAYLEQRPIFSADVARDDAANAPLYGMWNVRAVLAAPITLGEQRLGVLAIWAPRAPIFAESDMELVQLLARQAAAVLGSRFLLEQLSRARAREEADRLKDEFLASISHDLRNPLTGVTAVAQLLDRRLDRGASIEPERLRASLRSIMNSATQMTSLVDQLLDYARLQLDRPLDLNRQPTDLVELVQRVVASHETLSDRHQLRVDTVESSLVGLWDRDRLERVLQNLLGNAIKYSPQGGEINIKLWRELDEVAQWAIVTVRDSGVGIPAADLPHLFEQFYRATNVSGRIAGTGIGLATARQVVELHAGRIDVESEEGEGSTFTIRLPIGEDQGPADDNVATARNEALPERSRQTGDAAGAAWAPASA
jgi:signal transduction histidine kinase